MNILSRSRSSRAGQSSATAGLGIGCGVVVVVLVLFGLITTVHVVEPGHVGIKTSFGSVQNDTLKPGANILFPPFAYTVTDVDTRVHGITFGSNDPAQRFGAASIEYQDVFLQGTLNVHIDQEKAVDLYTKVGLDYDQKLVVPFFTTAIKEVVPQYHIGEILSKREEIRKKTVEKLQTKLQPYGIVVDDVAIANIDFSDQYKAAIEAKQVAEQQVQTESQILAQKKIQADQVKATAQGAADARVVQAKGNAEAAVIEASAQAEVNLKIATAQAEANRRLGASLTPEVIQYALVRALGPTIQTMILPSGQNFILDPKALLKTSQ